MKKNKILEAWYKFNPIELKNEFYSLIGNRESVPLNERLFGNIYSDESGVRYIEISDSTLSELIVPESIGMGHRKDCGNLAEYRVAVFLVNGRLYVVEGHDKEGSTFADWMAGYPRLFMATYDRNTHNWVIPISELRDAFDYESPLSTGVDKELGEYIAHLYELFNW